MPSVTERTVAPRWQQVELSLRAAGTYANPYTDLDVWVRFTHEDGEQLTRPAFWDGADTWRVRFASPRASGRWSWQAGSSPRDAGIAAASGTLVAAPSQSGNRFHRRGFWRIPAGKRNVAHADGTPALIVADTAWALPFRATPEQCEVYALDRQSKGFNAALLMTVQPDMEVCGPRSRTSRDGFDVGFEDLPAGHIERLNPAYFQSFDALVRILVDHEIVPVYQPVFHGYGWKGGRTAGPILPAAEYARYCRYLVARYGAMPAVWLVSGDGDGRAPGVEPGGREIEEWDCYGHPTGIHYGPNHEPSAHQDADWLDFQWCQTGHNGEHLPNRVATMWERRPVKAVANGEPTYEHIGLPGRAAGWWQGHEAWMNLTAGGTMGVVYGAGSLWQWRLDLQERHEAWAMAADADWRRALGFEGSRCVGLISRIFKDLPFAEMEPDYRHTYGRPGLIVAGKLLVLYLFAGGEVQIVRTDDVPPNYRVVDPRTGAVRVSAIFDPARPLVQTPPDEPSVVIFG